MGLAAQRNACPGLLTQYRKDGGARSTEHLDPRGGLQRLPICPRRTFSNEFHVELHGFRVRMHLDNRDFASVLVGVLVERNEAGFVRLDEVRKLRNTPLFVLELARLELVRGDEDERPGHFDSLHFWG